MSNVFVIGNGFDIDIGLKSKFDDFYDSDYWPFHGKNTPLAKFLELNCAVERWLDVEEALAEYGSKTISFGSHVDEDKEDFQLLKDSFNKYILNEQETFEPKNGVAAKLFSAVIDNGFLVTSTRLILRIFLIWQKRNYTSRNALNTAMFMVAHLTDRPS